MAIIIDLIISFYPISIIYFKIVEGFELRVEELATRNPQQFKWPICLKPIILLNLFFSEYIPRLNLELIKPLRVHPIEFEPGCALRIKKINLS